MQSPVGMQPKNPMSFFENSTDFVPNRYVFEKYRDRQFMRGSTASTFFRLFMAKMEVNKLLTTDPEFLPVPPYPE